MLNFETIIGIEIHLELNTKTKMFSRAANSLSAPANTCASLVDLAYPGTLPLVNQEAVKKAIKLAKALKMNIAHNLIFDRKNYFYADLPKGFQITQKDHPLAENGQIPVSPNQTVLIERIQLEEDTARSNHSGELTRLDYNRAGVPLIEIITLPMIHSKAKAVAYIKAIRQLARSLNISEAKMESGSLRADINISLRPFGEKQLQTRVEIKNLNSLSNVEQAIEQEIQAQTKKYLKGENIPLATKRFDEKTHSNKVMRVKMEEADYRFFPEPNIPIISLPAAFVEAVKIGELPWEVEKRLTNLKVNSDYIQQLINDPQKLNFINQLPPEYLIKGIKIYFAEVMAYVNAHKLNLKAIKLDPSDFVAMLAKLEQGEISGAHVKKIVPFLLATQDTLETIIAKHNFKQISDPATLSTLLDKIILEQQTFISANQDRPERIFKLLLGKLMQVSQGQANPIMAQKLLKQKLGG